MRRGAKPSERRLLTQAPLRKARQSGPGVGHVLRRRVTHPSIRHFAIAAESAIAYQRAGLRGDSDARTAQRPENTFQAVQAVLHDLEPALPRPIMKTLDGQRKDIINSAVPIRSDADKVIGAIIVNEDISELRAAQESLEELREYGA